MKKTITVAIPTYNRPTQILGLLNHFVDKYILYTEFIDIKLLVFDNSDNEETNIILNKSSILKNSWIRYNKNNTNLGFDKNILELYLNSTTDYVLLFGDDDFPEENIFLNITRGLESNPDILLLPFRQPLSLKVTQYQTEPFSLETNDAVKAILAITKNGKISSFVFRKIPFNIESYKRVLEFDQTGWMHLVLAFEILYSTINFKVTTLNTFCARALSDQNVKNLDWVPIAFIQFNILLKHPFIWSFRKNIDILKTWDGIYLTGIMLTCWGASTAWEVKGVSVKDYIKFGKDYPFRIYLFRKPIFLFYWILLKLNLSKIFIKHFIFLSERGGYK
jgi:glycosyltransferase involved in cell wall biosynthesis